MLYGAIFGGIAGLVIIVFMMLMKKKGGAVARFSQLVNCPGDVAQMLITVDGFLKERGYLPCTYNIETGIYRQGKGIATAAKYIKICAQEGGILVQAFVDVYGTESGLSGFTAAIPKKSCKKVVNQVIALIQNR